MSNNLLHLYFGTQNMPVSQNNNGMDKTRSNDNKNNELAPALKQDIGNVKDTFESFRSKLNDVKTEVDKFDTLTLENKGKNVFAAFQTDNLEKDSVKKAAFKALSPITPIRRISSLPDNVEDGNYLRATGLALLALNFLPEDLRDIKEAATQIGSKFSKRIKYTSTYEHTEFQHEFSFFKGTLLEFLLKLPGKKGAWLADKLSKADKTLYDTRLGKYLEKKLRFGIVDMRETGKTYGKDIKVWAFKFEGSRFAEIVARGLKRTTLLSVASLGMLEIPAIVKAFSKGNNVEEKAKNGTIQTLKSATYVTTITAGIGLVGALLSKRKGAYGSLLGMGIGSVIGATAYNSVKKLIDSINKN